MIRSSALRQSSPREADTLTSLLRATLTAHFGRPQEIVKVTRRPCVYTSSFRVDELDVRLAGGLRLRLVLKDFSLEAMVEDSRRVRPQFLYRPTAEMDNYRALLPHAPAGTPVFYGAVADEGTGRYWLFLEYVSGPQLSTVGRFSSWKRAAAWIATLHAALAPETARQSIRGASPLVYDADFYWRWMERAQRFAAADTTKRRRVDAVARRFGPIVDRLLRMPRTIIHGEFYPSNVIVNGPGGRRICPIDWEMASVGPGLVDLAALSSGWVEARQTDLARAYLRAAAGEPDRSAPMELSREFSRDLDCCHLYLAVRMMGWADKWAPPRTHARDWSAEAARVLDRLDS